MRLLTVTAVKNIDGSVSIYRENGDLFVMFDKYHPGKPDRRFKYISLNCYKWALNWEPLRCSDNDICHEKKQPQKCAASCARFRR